MKKIYLFLLSIFLIASATITAQKIDVIPLEFNSKADDFGASPIMMGRILYFTSEKSGKQKIYYVERTADGWTSPKSLSSDINAGKHTSCATLTPDGQYMIFAAFKHEIPSIGKTDLYSAEKVNGEWTNIKNLGPKINSEAWDAQPCLSSDGLTLYFASNRMGGFGNTDIYFSKRNRDGSWEQAQNMGSVVNSAYDDMSPIIGADNKTFTFSSNKPGGYGNFDVYISRITGENISQPKNAGGPINTEFDDMFYYPIPNSDRAYFSSNRKGTGSVGEYDIYMAVPNPYKTDAVVAMTGFVKDATTGDKLGAHISIVDLQTQKKVQEMRSDDESGVYYAVLQPGKVYSLTAWKKGYIFYSERYEVPPSEAGHEETKNIMLSKESTRLLIFFDFNKSNLQQESVPEMERVIEFMRENTSVKISLEGHTDNVGDPKYNEKLSLERANSAKKYLEAAGIEGSRIQTMGFGESKPLLPNNSDENKAKNRRVEMKIIK